MSDITREEAIKILKDTLYDEKTPTDYLKAVRMGREALENQKTGHWIYDDIVNNWRCDKCGETPKTMGYVGSNKFMAEHFKFCNHCGAKMEGE